MHEVALKTISYAKKHKQTQRNHQHGELEHVDDINEDLDRWH